MIKVDLRQGLDRSGTDAAIVHFGELGELFNHELNEPCQVVVVVNENLKQVLDSDTLIRPQLERLELRNRKLLAVRRVVD